MLKMKVGLVGSLYPCRMPIEIALPFRLSIHTCTNATTRKQLLGFSLYFMTENFKEISRTFSIVTRKEVSYNRVTNPLMPSSLFWHRHIQSKWVTKSAHQTARTSYWHESICPNVTPRFVSRNEIHQRQRSYSQKVTACSTLASVAYSVSATCFLKFRKRCKSVGLTLISNLVNDNGTKAGRLWTTLHAVPISHPVISNTLYSWRSTWPASDL